MQPVKGALQGWQFLLQKINCVATTNIWYLKPLEQKAHVKTRSHDDIHIHYIRHFFFLNLIKLWVLVDFIHSGRCLTGPACFPPCRWRCDDGGHGQVPGPPGPAGAGGRLAPSGGLHGLQHGRPVTEVRRTTTLRSPLKVWKIKRSWCSSVLNRKLLHTFGNFLHFHFHRRHVVDISFVVFMVFMLITVHQGIV